MKIPEANPIRFNVLPPDKDGEHWYFQKFQRSDITTIQILVDNSEPAQDWTLQIFNSDDILQVYFTILKVEFTTLVEGIKIIEFYIYFSQAEEGLHYFVLSGGTSKFYSDFLCIKDKHEETKLITYHNSVNDQSVIFSTGIIFNVRVEAQDRHTPKSLVPKSVDSIYDNDMGGYMTLYSNPFETYRINIGSNAGIPDYLMKTVNRAFGCDILLLDNNKVNKVEGATFETVEAENYPLRSWLIEVGYYNDDITYTAASYGNPICQKVIELFVSASYGNPVCQKIDQTITYTSAEWTEPVCQKYDNSVSYTEAEWTNPICQQVSDVILLSIHLIKTGGFTTPNMF
ncbi:MAG: hypothetical protein LBC68_07715, partial [Prevotellaceae bacterium]|nr:hypothetical protein [Prevotellaceae bacterium]